jgi:hypothetical protein
MRSRGSLMCFLLRDSLLVGLLSCSRTPTRQPLPTPVLITPSAVVQPDVSVVQPDVQPIERVAATPLSLSLTFVGAVTNAQLRTTPLVFVNAHTPAPADGDVPAGNLQAWQVEHDTVWLHGGRNTALTLRTGVPRSLTAADLWAGALQPTGEHTVLFLGERGLAKGIALLDNHGQRRWRQESLERPSATGDATHLAAWAMTLSHDRATRTHYVVGNDFGSIARVNLADGMLHTVSAPPHIERALSGGVISAGRLFRITHDGTTATLHQITLASGAHDTFALAQSTDLGLYASCARDVPEPMVLLGAATADLLIGHASQSLVFLRTDGVIVATLDLAHGIAHDRSDIAVGCARCDGMFVVDRTTPHALPLRVAGADALNARLVGGSSQGWSVFTHGDCRPRGFGLPPRVLVVQRNGTVRIESSSCRDQQASVFPGQVTLHPTVSPDGSVLLVVRERGGFFVVRVQAMP